MKALILSVALLAGCATSSEAFLKDVRQSADTLDKALNVGEVILSTGIESVCQEAGEQSDPCKSARKVGLKAGPALAKAREAVQAYREFSGSYEAAEDAVLAVKDIVDELF